MMLTHNTKILYNRMSQVLHKSWGMLLLTNVILRPPQRIDADSPNGYALFGILFVRQLSNWNLIYLGEPRNSP